jgi:hypothetical protein
MAKTFLARSHSRPNPRPNSRPHFVRSYYYTVHSNRRSVYNTPQYLWGMLSLTNARGQRRCNETGRIRRAWDIWGAILSILDNPTLANLLRSHAHARTPINDWERAIIEFTLLDPHPLRIRQIAGGPDDLDSPNAWVIEGAGRTVPYTEHMQDRAKLLASWLRCNPTP